MIAADPIFHTVSDYIDIVDTALATLSRRLPAHVGRDDLASVGKIALISALEQDRGSPDETRAYCFVRVRGAMLDELRRLDPLSRRHRDIVNLVSKTQTDLGNRLGRTPSRAETAAAAGLPLGDVTRALAAAEADTEFSEAEWQGVPDTVTPSPAETVESEDLRFALRSAFERLSSVQALVLHRYYFEDATLEAISEDIGVSKERVRQIRNAAETRLRQDFTVLSIWQSLVTTR